MQGQIAPQPTQRATARAHRRARAAGPEPSGGTQQRPEPEEVGGSRASRVSSTAIVGIASLYAAIGLTWFMAEAALLREFAFLILISTGAASALADRLKAEWKSPFFVVGGGGAIFVFVCLVGFAFLHPEHFGTISGSLLGKSQRPRGISNRLVR